MENKTFQLNNYLNIPVVGYGTGVIWSYSRNYPLFLKTNLPLMLSSIKHRKLNKELKRNIKARYYLNTAYQTGFRLFDSGRIYGYSEKVIGKMLNHIPREELFLATKISDMDITRAASPDTVKDNLDLSLKYLKTDYVDLYLLHWPSGNWIDIYLQMEALYKEGKVRALGVCNFQIEHFEKLMQQASILPAVCQVECHPIYTQEALKEYCKRNGIQLMAHTPTGRMCPQISENKTLEKIASTHGKKIVQIILRWHIQSGVIPVISSSSRTHLKENFDIFDFLLSENEMKSIDMLNKDFTFFKSTGIDNPQFIYNL